MKKVTSAADCINHFDLAFIVDTTGSMGGFISSAKQQMVDIIVDLVQRDNIDIRVAVVEYRDHPPQDSVLTKVHDFDTLMKMKAVVNRLEIGGGGDHPEAVFDGIVAATKLEWRKHAKRTSILIGDAPPHGVGCSGDAFSCGCPCGETIGSTTEKMEAQSIILHSISLGHDAEASFKLLASLTGGTHYPASGLGNPLDRIEHSWTRILVIFSLTAKC